MVSFAGARLKLHTKTGVHKLSIVADNQPAPNLPREERPDLGSRCIASTHALIGQFQLIKNVSQPL